MADQIKVTQAREREPLLYCVVGKKGVGKTYKTKELIKKYVRGNPAMGIPPRKVLVLDVNNEFSDIKPMECTKEMIYKFMLQRKVQARRISVYKTTGDKKNLKEIAEDLSMILDTFCDGLLLVEDINKFVSDTMDTDLIGALCTQRHVGCDIIIHYQLLGKAGNPKIKGNMNVLRYHKVTDSVERHKNKFDDKVEILKIAEILVNKVYEQRIPRFLDNDGNVRFCVYINFDTNTISGEFNKKEFLDAVEYYIMQNENETIKPVMNLKDKKTGEKLYNYAQAFKYAQEKLYRTFYGNK